MAEGRLFGGGAGRLGEISSSCSKPHNGKRPPFLLSRRPKTAGLSAFHLMPVRVKTKSVAEHGVFACQHGDSRKGSYDHNPDKMGSPSHAPKLW